MVKKERRITRFTGWFKRRSSPEADDHASIPRNDSVASMPVTEPPPAYRSDQQRRHSYSDIITSLNRKRPQRGYQPYSEERQSEHRPPHEDHPHEEFGGPATESRRDIHGGSAPNLYRPANRSSLGFFSVTASTSTRGEGAHAPLPSGASAGYGAAYRTENTLHHEPASNGALETESYASEHLAPAEPPLPDMPLPPSIIITLSTLDSVTSDNHATGGITSNGIATDPITHADVAAASADADVRRDMGRDSPPVDNWVPVGEHPEPEESLRSRRSSEWSGLDSSTPQDSLASLRSQRSSELSGRQEQDSARPQPSSEFRPRERPISEWSRPQAPRHSRRSSDWERWGPAGRDSPRSSRSSGGNSRDSAPSTNSPPPSPQRQAHRRSRMSINVRTADPTRPQIDYAHHPGVVIALLQVMDKKALLLFRATCRRHAALVNELFGAHVLVKGGYQATSALGRAPACFDGRRWGRGRNLLGVVGRGHVGVLSFEGGLRLWDPVEEEAEAAAARLRQRLQRVEPPIVRCSDLAFDFPHDVNPHTFIWFQTDAHREVVVPTTTRRLVLNLRGSWRAPIVNYADLELDEVVVHPSGWTGEEDWAWRAECVAAVANMLLLDLLADTHTESGEEYEVDAGDLVRDVAAGAGDSRRPAGGEEVVAGGDGIAWVPRARPRPKTMAVYSPRPLAARVLVVGFDPIAEQQHDALPQRKRDALPLVADGKIVEWDRFTDPARITSVDHVAPFARADLMHVLDRITFFSAAEYRAHVGERRWILETERDGGACATKMRLARS